MSLKRDGTQNVTAGENKNPYSYMNITQDFCDIAYLKVR